MILYWPCASVDTERTFSINTGLAASTVTPGSTAPVVSFTPPVKPVSWARAPAANRSVSAALTTTDPRSSFRLIRSPMGNGCDASNNYRLSDLLLVFLVVQPHVDVPHAAQLGTGPSRGREIL